MTDISSNDSRENINYSTDYMTNLLQNTIKVDEEKKNNFNIKNILNNNNKDNDTENESISHFVSPTETQNNTTNFFGTIQEKRPEPNYTVPQNASKSQKHPQNLDNDEDDYMYLSKDKQYMKKLDILQKLGDLTKNGTKLSQAYSINSDYFIMKYEYELHKKSKNKIKTINWMNGLLYSIVEGTEILCSETDYIKSKVDLTGWTEKTHSQMDEYTEAFSALLDEYNIGGKDYPALLQLAFLFFGGAISVAIQNKIPNTEQYTPSEIERLRKKAIQDREQAIGSVNKKKDRMNENIISEIKEMEFLKESKENFYKKQEEMEKLKKEYEKTIVMDDITKQRHDTLQQMKSNLQNLNISPTVSSPKNILYENNSSSSLSEKSNSQNENNNSNSKKSQSIYTKSRKGKKGLVINI